MKTQRPVEFDEIGIWSEVKLSILQEYAKPYNEILRSKKLKPIYVDAFAGAGHHIAKHSKEIVKGSPVRAMEVSPPFEHLYFVDMNDARVGELNRLSEQNGRVTVLHGDTNVILPRDVFPHIQWEQYRRGLCILDPYGLNLDWSLIQGAAQLGTVEIFLNFPVMDMNRNVLWHNHESVNAAQRDRMTRFWGDETWHNVAYSGAGNLFGELEKVGNDEIAQAFRERLKKVAGFRYVPDPIPMRNSVGNIVYYLFFAAHQAVAANIVSDIFNKYMYAGENS